MLYRDYLKSKYQNTAVKLANAEGVPCVLEYSKGKNIRNYEVYGNSETGKNLLDIPSEYTWTGYAQKSTHIPAGQYVLSWTSTIWGGASSPVIRFAKNNKQYWMQKNSSFRSFTLTQPETTIQVYANDFSVTESKDVTSTINQLMLELGTTATEYEPYTEKYVGDKTLVSDNTYKYKIPIVNSGKNLLSYPYNYTTRTENGLTFTDNGDGSIKINGTATIQTGFMFRNQIIDIIDKTKAYVLSGVKDSNVYLQIDFYNGTTWKKLVNTGNDGKTIIDFTKMNFDYTRVSVALVVKANTVCDNITIKPQLELGETATEYEPYRVPVTANIYLDEPLRKIGDYADYIDFKGQRVVRKVGVLDNTSTKPISESLVALAIPTEEPIPLPALKTFKGTNIISVDTSVQPSNIKAKYVRL